MRKWLYIIVVGLLALLLLLAGYNKLRSNQKEDILSTPVVGLEAVNEKIYGGGTEILAEDFTVYQVHEKGNKVKLSEHEFTFSPSVASLIGEVTEITVSSTTYPELSCVVAVQNERLIVASYYVGYPVITDVIATIYSNGELEFTGKGNIKNYSTKEMPWRAYDYAKEYPIRSVVFEENVAPVSMDYWFSGMTYLTYINKIPASVQSMEGTFANCIYMTDGPDWSECTRLTNLNSTFRGNVSLMNVYPIPSSVTLMNNLCEDCISMENAPDMSCAKNVAYMENAFTGCSSLQKVGPLPPNVLDIAGCFEGCINLVTAPEIPETVTIMKNTFNGCTRLTTASVIPASVQNISGTYMNCPMLCGTITIHANPNQYSRFLTGSVVSVSAELTGDSSMLNIIALTKDVIADVTVKGNVPYEGLLR